MDQKITQILETKEETEIKNLIYTIRGKQVMLDGDIAELFNVETRKLNQQVKRNPNRFPEDFCFKLNSLEFKNLMSQNVISSYGGRRKLPLVFSEQGVIALAGVLKSDVADEMSVKISRVFVKMRNALITYAEPLKYLCQLHGEVYDLKEFTLKKFDEAFTRIEKLEPKKEVLLLNGEWFDAAEAMIKLVERAKESLVMVDAYGDHTALGYLSHRKEGVKLTLYKSEYSKLKGVEIEAFKKQYGEIEIKQFNASHNRYLIIDSQEVYDLGTSPNNMGNKIFDINKEELDEVKDVLIKLFP